MATTGTGDLALSYTAATQGQVVNGLALNAGDLIVNLTPTPQGDAALVFGPRRMVQDVVRMLVLNEGDTPLDPTLAASLTALVGQATGVDDPSVEDVLAQAEAAIVARHQAEIAAGTRTPDAAVASFSSTYVTTPQPGVQRVAFTVYSQAGHSTEAVLPTPLTVRG